jgi:hypothetical protein
VDVVLIAPDVEHAGRIEKQVRRITSEERYKRLAVRNPDQTKRTKPEPWHIRALPAATTLPAPIPTRGVLQNPDR